MALHRLAPALQHAGQIARADLQVGAQSEVRDLLRDIAGAMAEGNARRVAGFIDPRLRDFARLERDLAALVEQYEITTAIDVVRDEGDERSRALVSPGVPVRFVRRPHAARDVERQTVVKGYDENETENRPCN